MLNTYSSLDLNSQVDGRALIYNTGGPGDVESRNYKLNADNSLKSTSGSGDSVPANTSYSYDTNGNRTSDSNHSSIQVGANNQITSDGVSSYTYDFDGNLLTKISIATHTETDYTWDYRNRLTEVTTKTAQGVVTLDVKYIYDPLDRRIGATTLRYDSNGTPTSSSTTFTTYDGLSSTPYADFDASGQIRMRYLWLNEGAVDELLARLDPVNGPAWYLTDNENSIHEIVDPSGNVLDRLSYDPFGQLAAESNPQNGDRFKYASGAYDPNTGLIQFGLRYYDPYSGRWISQDPGGYAMGDSNLYRYVGNSPTSAVDPTGLYEQPTTYSMAADDGSLASSNGHPGYGAYYSGFASSLWDSAWGTAKSIAGWGQSVATDFPGGVLAMATTDGASRAAWDNITGRYFETAESNGAKIAAIEQTRGVDVANASSPELAYAGLSSWVWQNGTEAAYGTDIQTGRALDAWERSQRGAFAVSDVANAFALSLTVAQSALPRSVLSKNPFSFGRSSLSDEEIVSLLRSRGNPEASLELRDALSVNSKNRLPRSQGQWVEGTPGSGAWKSDLPDVNAITGNKPVQFVDGRPIFTPWSKGEIKFKPGLLNGSQADFDAVYDYIANKKGLPSRNAAKNYLRDAGLTPHHLDSTTIQLIPSDMHGNIPHIGSASDLRGGFR